MLIATWNVNSIRVRLAAVIGWLETHRPDVLALQELKTQAEAFPYDELRAIGYHAAVLGQKTYNGVALLSREPLEEVSFGTPQHAWDEAARIISGRLGSLTAMNVYVPNGGEVDSEKYAYKLRWLDALAEHLGAARDPAHPLILLGDFNIAPDHRDIANPEEAQHETLFTPRERERLQGLFDWGLVDVWRQSRDEGGSYSWWDYRMNAFRRNVGARIDLILATRELASRCTACEIDREPRKAEKASDHAPVWVRWEA